MTTKTAILFDLDGTIVDSIDLLLDCMEYAFQDEDRMPSRADWLAGIGTPLRSQITSFGILEDAKIESIAERYRVYQDRMLEAKTTVYPGIETTLLEIGNKGILTGIVTSKGKGMTQRTLEHVGLLDVFDTVVTAHDTKLHKPDPQPVIFALESLNVRAENAIFIGDSIYDMLAGKSAGTMTGAALWGPFSKKVLEPSHPTNWLNSPADVLDMAAKLFPLNNL